MLFAPYGLATHIAIRQCFTLHLECHFPAPVLQARSVSDTVQDPGLKTISHATYGARHV